MTKMKFDQNRLPIEEILIEPCHDAENNWINWLATMPNMPGYVGIGSNPTDALTNFLDEIERGPLHKVKLSAFGSKSHQKELDVHSRAKAALRSIINDGKRGSNIEAAASKFKVSKGELYSWIKRYDEVIQSCNGDIKLENAHRRAMLSPNVTSNPCEDKITAAYQQRWRARTRFPKMAEIAEPQS